MKKRIFFFFPLLWLLLPGLSCAEDLIDLEEHTDDFILETKQIIVPGFPGAFNASIIRWQGHLLLCFRIRDSKMVSTFEMGLVWLDDDFNPISTPQILEIWGQNPSSYIKNQDPRLIIINQRLYILYSNFIDLDGIITRRMFIAELQNDYEKFFIENPICLHSFEKTKKRWEKNWVPFNYYENLLLAYSIIPHHILKPFLDSGTCTTISLAPSSIDWQWGELRGGTPAILDGNEYLAFFHSSKIMATAHSRGKKIQHYFMGAYTFAAQPPFAITRMSPRPIVGKNFYHGQEYPTWKPLHVVFPVGLLADENYLWVTYGRQDFEIWVTKIDKKGLYKSLVPCSSEASKLGECLYQLCQPLTKIEELL